MIDVLQELFLRPCCWDCVCRDFPPCKTGLSFDPKLSNPKNTLNKGQKASKSRGSTE